ncbi:Gfo/Idh/MocA family oxidoreductase [Octadecabacter sp. 1_MG-2023]|uniref:Gfo/Idh/MocA family protein n=1 Tax=unclassified Octadecabacter TaxID=196158 RepID=UPI0026E48449|nr:Gfo/Idh/MocA family oxidoreductase [Octadecabacter sp. 1_MG-2023]MDO6734321.1 Gfo/Idh/MocA family oxidoreductase [Octadecabacter sp. 1_MG-2023]
MSTPLRFAAIGIDHRHVYGMAANLIDAGAEFVGWATEGHPNTEDGFVARFPDVPRAENGEALLADPSIDFIVLSGIPRDRAAWAVRAMEAGKDVLSDKPGCTTFEQLAALQAAVEVTGRIWSIDFSERFEVPAVTRAAELVAEGAIGRVIQTIGIGPHRLNKPTRPDWFFERDAYGGILTDIASHQIDQFLFFTGSDDAEITTACVANYANPDDAGLQDFGEIGLRSANGHGYIRVDWYTPDALPTWGDGRLTILGTEGYIELRKYVDVGREGTDHVIVVNGTRCETIDASDAGLPFFATLIDDFRTRGQKAMTQAHVFKVCELTLRAQAIAEGKAV